MKTISLKLEEFRKLGYELGQHSELRKINSNTKIHGSIQEQFKSQSKHSNKQTNSRISLDSNKTKRTRIVTKYDSSISEKDRFTMGLVTAMRPGVDYTLQSNGTKVCRCCQKTLKAENFSIARNNYDGKVRICKACDLRKAKYYQANRF